MELEQFVKGKEPIAFSAQHFVAQWYNTSVIMRLY